MGKQVKRWLSIVLAIAICLGIGPLLKMNLKAKASNDEEFYSGTYQDYEYSAYNRKYAVGEQDYSNIPDDWVVTISKYNGNASNVKIPKTIDGNPVYYIADAFKNNENLQSVTIPNTVEMILEEAFQGCKNLETVTFEDKSNLFAIEADAFADCPKLRTITIPKSVDRITCDTNPFYLDDMDFDYSAFSGSGLTTIYGYSGSAAEEYAKNKNITFIAVGDSNNGNSNQNNSGKKIAIYTSNPSLSLIKGQVLTLGFQIEVNGVQDGQWRQLAITNSDPTVISVETIEGNYDKFTYVTARKAGISNLTVSDPETGISRTIEIKVSDPSSPRMYPVRMPNDSHFELNGMVLDSYSCTYDKASNQYVIHMDAYNYNLFSGAIDIYDSNGKYKGSNEIKGREVPNNLNKYNTYFFFDLPFDYVSGERYTYKGKSVTKHSSLNFKVPQGGYFTVSNNLCDSPGTFVYNGLDLAFQIMNSSKKVIKAFQVPEIDKAKDSAKKALVDKMIANTNDKALEQITKKIQDIFKKVGKKALTNEDAVSVTQSLLRLFSDYCRTLNYDLKKEMIKGIKQFIQKDLLGACVEFIEWYGEQLLFPPGTPNAKAKDAIVELEKTAALGIKLVQINQSLDSPHSFFYTDDYSQQAHNSGILVKPNNNVGPNVKVQAFRVYSFNPWKSFSNKDDYDELINNSILYNISLVENDKTVQPSGKVQVQIPKPAGLLEDRCYVYRQEENGTWTQLNARAVGNYLVFETDHFSLYAITGDKQELVIKSLPHKLVYNIYDYLDLTGLELVCGDEIIKDSYICTPQLLTDSGECEITISYGFAETSFKVRVENNGFVLGDDGITRYYKDNKVDINLTDVKQDTRTNIWFNVVNGVVTPGPTIAQNSYGWWYIDGDGKVDFNAQSIYQNKYGWWKTTNGKVTFKENGVFQNGYGWWRVKDSKVDFKAQGIYQNQYGWWKTTDGKVTFKENGVFQNEYGWWKVKDSKVDFNFTGIASNKYGSWYIKEGKVDFKKNGKVKYNGKTYTIKNGKVV